MIFINKYATSQEVQDAVDNKELSKPYVAYITGEDKIDWNSKEETDYSKMYLTFEALENGSFGFRNWGYSTKSYSYSVNNGEWIITSDLVTTINLNIGDTVRFKSTDDISGLFDNFIAIDFKIYGNILSVKYGDNFVGAEGPTSFNFSGSKVVDASNLVLPTNNVIFSSMFRGCTSLTKAPALPTTTLASYCYNSMFQGCTSLTVAPELPATTLANSCYQSMFEGCTNLNYIKCLATDISATDCTALWAHNVASIGTFVKKAGVEWPTGANGIPDGWTVVEE